MMNTETTTQPTARTLKRFLCYNRWCDHLVVHRGQYCVSCSAPGKIGASARRDTVPAG